VGVEDLIGAIGGDAARRIDEIRAGAREQAEAILREAGEEGRRIVEGAAARGEAAARAEAARIVSAARLAARRELLAARQRLVEQALDLVGARLRAHSASPAYAGTLVSLLRECGDTADGPLVVRCRPEDRPLLEAAARGIGLEATLEDADLPFGGVETASGPGGRVVCRNGMADRLEAARPLLLEVAARELFGGGGGRT